MGISLVFADVTVLLSWMSAGLQSFSDSMHSSSPGPWPHHQHPRRTLWSLMSQLLAGGKLIRMC